MKKIIVVIVAISITLISCKLGRTTKPSEEQLTDVQYCQRGWSAYSAGNYSSAVTNFLSAKNINGDYIEAYVGLGWAYMQQANYSGAITEFAYAKTHLPTDLRILVALAGLYIKDNNGTSAIAELVGYVSGTDTWVHPQDSRINAVDIHNLLAEGYIITNTLGTSGASLNALNAWGQVKKSLELNSNDAKAIELREYLLSL